MAKMSYDRRKWGRLVTGLAVFAPLPAAALTININAGGGLSGNAAALAAFNRAADQWEAIFTDNVTVNIAADYLNLGSSTILGQASSSLFIGPYDTVRNAIVVDGSNETDDAIVASLPTAAQWSGLIPAGFSVANAMVGTSANMKALGFAVNPASDASITFNNTFNFDLDNGDGVAVGTYDFETVAAHEIGHALGFVSAVDFVDQNASGVISMNPLDLFRFDSDNPANIPANAAQFTSLPRDLTPGGKALFSDVALQAAFSTGVSKGDGRQASHWKDNALTGSQLGIMDPTLSSGQVSPITAADIRALDVIGWDFVPVPVPAALFLFAPALAGLFGIGWRNRALSV